MRLFISAGEASGDAYGAEIVRALSPERGSVVAIGGRRLQEAGARLLADSSTWGAVGILESLKVVPKVYRSYARARSDLDADPGLFIPIDFGYVNVRLAKRAKSRGWKVLYFIPPGSWRRSDQGADLPQITDAVVTPFPWSAQILRDKGVDAYFFGHPLKEMVARTPEPPFREGIAVLPGSRTHEIQHNLEAIIPAINRLGLPANVALAPNVRESSFLVQWRALGGGEVTLSRDTYAVLKGARAGVVCSGTATLEAALSNLPMVVVYRGSRLMQFEYRIRRPKFDFFSLPNIILDRKAVPELLQDEASPEGIEGHLAGLLASGSLREAQLHAFAEINGLLGAENCFEDTAKVARKLMGPQ
ncbi:MAG: hypothetical protein KIT11_04510 [Fimbriimonadaceae bacterium]|nr:hypothetical protein [Fimbriimonadaceae bacterium]QYK56844.1 MAG: hypothetical protein KF733_05015 [Fimbriimonadaceae bacterium]